MEQEGDGLVGPQPELLGIITTIDEIQKDIDKEKTIQQTLNEKIGYTSEGLLEDVQNRKAQRDRNEGEKKQLENQISEFNDEINNRTTALEHRTRDLSKKYNNRDVKFAQVALTRCQNTKQAYSKAIQYFLNTEREEIRKLTEEYFLKGTNSPKLYTGLQLDEDYRMHLEVSTLKDLNGNPETRPAWIIGASAGQSSIIALSFVAALRKKSKNEAPIIIDTPLGVMDYEHSDAAVKFWPKIGGQVIILYQPKELDQQSIELLEPYTSHHHHAKRDEDMPDCSYITDWDGVYENRGGSQ